MNYQYVMYKPRKEKNGVAANFKVVAMKKGDKTEWACFLGLAKQLPSDGENDKFEWKDANDKPKTVIKLDLPDLGAFLSMFNGKTGTVKLYHEFEREGKKIVTSISASPYFAANTKEAKGYSVNITRGEDKFGFGISFSEAEILSVLFKQAVSSICELHF